MSRGRWEAVICDSVRALLARSGPQGRDKKRRLVRRRPSLQLHRFEQFEPRYLLSSPIIQSIARATPSGPYTNATSVSYTVTFDKSVTGVDATDFQLALSGVQASAPVVSGNGAIYTVTVNDISGNGTLGLNLVDDDSIHDATGNTLQGGTTASFQDQLIYDTDSGPNGITVSDVNGDGKSDLITANYFSNNVSVLLGNGDGTFQDQATFAADTNPYSVTAQDVNDDDKLDLLVANTGSSDVSVLLGNGDGTFQPQATFAAGLSPRSIACADVNGDGRPDLLVANDGDNNLSVLLGNGDGTFQAQATFSTGYTPHSVISRDVNEDGKPDLIVANQNSASISVLLGNGDGTFQPQVTYAAGSSPLSVVSTDVNGDGRPDLIVSNYLSYNVSVLLGNGDGTFQSQETFAVGRKPFSVASADVNGDGRPDLVVVNGSDRNMGVLLGNGDGTFRTQTTFTTDRSPRAVALVDVNGDGKLDVIVANGHGNTVSVLLNSSNGDFTGEVYNILQARPRVLSINRADPAERATTAGSVTYTVTFSHDVTGVDPTDFQLDLNGVSASAPVVSGTGSVYNVTIDGISGAGTLRLNLIDDGSIEDIAGNHLGGNVAVFQSQETFGTGSNPWSVAAADVNGDDKADMIVANQGDGTVGVFLGIGDGTFQAQSTFGTDGNSRSVAVADVNGDGTPDILATNLYGSVSVLLGNGDGTFQTQQTFSADGGPNCVTVSDVNGDGMPDLIVANRFSNDVSLLLGNGDGTFQSAANFSTGADPRSVTVADVNHDGNLDVLTANLSGSASLLLGYGNGTFHPQVTLATGPTPISVATADLDGDGNLDVMLADYGSHNVTVLLGNGDGTFQPQASFAAGSGPASVVSADVDGDGNQDLIVSNFASGNVSVLLGFGNGAFKSQSTFATDANPYSVAVADVNGDGLPDLLTANRSGGDASVLLNNGGTIGDGGFTGETYTILSPLVPFVQSINRASPSGPFTSSGSVTYTVTFNSSVTGVDADDFKVVTSGNVRADSTVSVSGSGSTYTVTIYGIHGNGDVRLDLIDNDTITAGGNPLGGPGTSNGSFQGQGYSIMQSGPRVTSIDQATPDTASTNSTSVVYTVAFNTDVTGVDPTDFQLELNGLTASSLDVSGSGSVYSVTIDNIDGSGTLGLNLVDDGTIRDLAGNPLQSPGATFQSEQTLSTGAMPTAVASADVDGDGVPDLIVLNADENNASVFLGNGDGTFQATGSYDTDSLPLSATVADVNGDGMPDLIVASQNYSAVSVLLGNGDGTFQEQLDFNAGFNPSSVQSADLDGDGKADLVVANSTGQVNVLLGNGDGTFQPRQSFPADAGSFSLAIADVDGDGIPDLLVANYDSNDVSILLGNGDGTFQNQQTYAAGVHPNAIISTDVDGDGNADLVVANRDDGSVSVLLGNGDGTFQSQLTFDAGPVPHSMVSADVNGDGAPDLIVANFLAYGGLSVLLGNSDGTFQSPQTFAVDANPFSVTSADLNNDGRPDLIAANSGSDTMSVLLNNGNGNFTGPVYTIDTIAPVVTLTTPTDGSASSNALPTFNGAAGTSAGDSSTITVEIYSGNSIDGTPIQTLTATEQNGVYSMTVSSELASGTYTAWATQADAFGNIGYSEAHTFTIDSIAPDITLESPTNGSSMNNTTPTFSGAAGTDAGDSSTITVKIYAGSSAAGTPVQTLTTTASGGSYSVPVSSALVAGTYTAQASQSDAVGNVGFSAANTFTIDVSAPVVSLTSPANGSSVNQILPTFNGMAGTAAGDLSTITVRIYSGNSATGTPIETITTTASGGEYSVQASSSLTVGNYTAQASQSDAAGNIGSSSASTFTVDPNAPLVTLSTPANGSSTSNTTPTFIGSIGTAAGDIPTITVRIYAGTTATGTPVQTLTVTTSIGAYSVTATSPLADGTYTAQASQSDSGGNVGHSNLTTFTIDTAAPVVTLNSPANGGSTTNGTPTFSGAAGTATGDSSTITVKIYAGTVASGTPIQTLTTTASGGVYSVPASLLSLGTYTAKASQSDAVGNTGTSAANTFTITYAGPLVQSINRATPSGPYTNATSVSYTVTFNGSVSGVDPTDFKVVTAGNVIANSTVAVSGSGSTYTVTVNGIRGNGDLRLDLIDNDSIGAGGLLLGGNGANNGSFQGQTYNILQAGPKVLSINRTSPAGSSTTSSTVVYTVTFSSSVTGVDAGDFQLALSGVSASAPIVSGSGSVYTVTINSIGGAGTLGLNLVDDGSIHDTVGNPLQRNSASFQSPATYSTGVQPHSVATADLNGDGKPDLIVLNGSGTSNNSFGVLLGNGDGTFQTQQTFATASDPSSVTTADVNGDGKPDLLIANYFGTSVSVLLGNGNGTFQPRADFFTGFDERFVSAADLNSDGKADLIVANAGDQTVSVRFGNGDGTFQALQSFAAGSYAWSANVADVNSDGKADLVIINAIGSVSVLLGNGNGTFQPQQTYAVSSNSILGSTSDVNADNKVDLLVVSSSGRVSVLLGNGDGTFQSQHTYATGSNPQSIVAADVNGDGRPDVIVANSGVNTLSVLLGNGDGTFQSQVTFATADPSVFFITNPRSVNSADVNGDGKPDLLVANYSNQTVSVLLGGGNGNFTGQVYTILQTGPQVLSINRNNPSSQYTSATSVSYTVTFNSSVTGVDASDFKLFTAGSAYASLPVSVTGSGSTYTVTINGIHGNGDLRLDLIDDNSISAAGVPLVGPATPNGSFQGQAYGILQSGPQVTSINRSLPAGPNTTANSVSYAVTFSGNVTGVDPTDFQLVLNGLTASSPVVSGSGSSYTVTVNNITGTGTLGLNLVDDGSIRDTAGNRLRGSGASFQSQQTFAAGQFPYSVATADVNGDGKLDLIAGNSSSTSNGIAVLLGNGDGTFQAKQTFATGSAPVNVAASDVNGDGRPDVIAVNALSATVSVLLNNGSGGFQGQTTFAVGSRPSGIAVVDLNHDGKPDLVVTNINDASVSVLLGNGDGTFQSQVTFAAGLHPETVVAADLNNDGNPDLAITNTTSSGGVSELLGNGDGTFQPRVTLATGQYPFSIVVNDFNGDGKPDLAAGNFYTSNSVSVLLGNGNGTFQNQATFAAGIRPGAMAAADLNGDGKLDLVVDNFDSNTVSIFLGNGDGTLQPRTTFSISASGQTLQMSAADLNGDGRPDLVVADQNGGGVDVLLNNANDNFTGQSYNIDTVAPTVNPTFAYDTGHQIVLSFSEDVSATVSAGSISVASAPGGSPVAVVNYHYDLQTNTATFTLPTSLADGNYLATWQPNSIADAAGNHLASSGSFSFFVLGGDAGHDGVVNISDLLAIAKNWQGNGKVYSQGDFNYDTKVDLADLRILAANWTNSAGGPALSPMMAVLGLPPTVPPAPAISTTTSTSDQTQALTATIIVPPTPTSTEAAPALTETSTAPPSDTFALAQSDPSIVTNELPLPPPSVNAPANLVVDPPVAVVTATLTPAAVVVTTLPTEPVLEMPSTISTSPQQATAPVQIAKKTAPKPVTFAPMHHKKKAALGKSHTTSIDPAKTKLTNPAHVKPSKHSPPKPLPKSASVTYQAPPPPVGSPFAKGPKISSHWVIDQLGSVDQ